MHENGMLSLNQLIATHWGVCKSIRTAHRRSVKTLSIHFRIKSLHVWPKLSYNLQQLHVKIDNVQTY